MRRCWPACALVLALLLLDGCLPARRVLFIVKDYWWQAFNREDGLNRELTGLASRAEFRFDLLVVGTGQDLNTRASDRLRAADIDFAIAGPVASIELDRMRMGEFDVPLVLTGSHFSASHSEELLIAFDRRAAFRQAGASCAKLLEINSRDAALVADLAPDARVGIVFLPSSDWRAGELEVFEDAFSEIASEGLVRREVTDADNRIAARKTLERMAEAGVAIYLLATLDLTPYCLEVLSQMGGVAIVEDWWGGGFEHVVLFSIVEDISDAFAAALTWFDERGQLPSGRVRLLYGGGLSLTDAVLRDVGLMP